MAAIKRYRSDWALAGVMAAALAVTAGCESAGAMLAENGEGGSDIELVGSAGERDYVVRLDGSELASAELPGEVGAVQMRSEGLAVGLEPGEEEGDWWNVRVEQEGDDYVGRLSEELQRTLEEGLAGRSQAEGEEEGMLAQAIRAGSEMGELSAVPAALGEHVLEAVEAGDLESPEAVSFAQGLRGGEAVPFELVESDRVLVRGQLELMSNEAN